MSRRDSPGLPEPVPERLIGGAPEVLVDHMLGAWSDGADVFPADIRAAYTSQFRDPGRVHAICEQYRAAAALDYQHDQADRERRRITCPTLVLWSQTSPVADWYQPLEVWKAWARHVRGGPIATGHFIPEEAPDLTARYLTRIPRPTPPRQLPQAGPTRRLSPGPGGDFQTADLALPRHGVAAAFSAASPTNPRPC